MDFQLGYVKKNKPIYFALFLFCTSGIIAQSDSAKVQSPYYTYKLGKRTFSLQFGAHAYLAGKFKSEYGEYKLTGKEWKVLTFGCALEKKSSKRKIIYRTELEIGELPTRFISSVPPNASDSVYLPLGLNLDWIDLSIFHSTITYGMGINKLKNYRFFYSAFVSPALSVSRSSIDYRFYESGPPNQIGQQRDTTFIFGIIHRILVPGMRFRTSIGRQHARFSFGLSAVADFWFVSPIKGKYTFFQNLAEESKGTYNSSKVNFGLQVFIGFCPYIKTKKN